MEAPTEPSEEERRHHALTHIPYQPWCEECVLAKGRDPPHRRTHPELRPTNLVESDYFFLGTNGERVAQESRAKCTVLCLTHTDSGLIAATVVEHKGRKDAFGAGTAARFIEDLGEKTITLRMDQEPAIRAWAARVKKEA